MRLIVLGSSSSGNGYILRASDGQSLIIEAGVKLIEAKKALSFDLSKIAGVLVSHSHGDHSVHISEYQRAGLNCYMNEATRVTRFGYERPNVIVLKEKTTYQIGPFKVMPILLKHDVPNFGYLIDHPESGLFPFITDTHYCPFRFPGMNNIMVEANYSDKIIERRLQEGSTIGFVRNRVIQSHMEIDTTLDFLRANDLSKVNNIVLLHLSSGNSDAPEFMRLVRNMTGKSVFVAKKGMDIEFNKTAF